METAIPMLEQIVELLLWPCWKGSSDSYKAKYARTIWQQFEEKVRSAAYTASLTKFLESLRAKMDIEIRKDDLLLVNQAMQLEPRATLSALRKETTALVIMVRLLNEERKVEYQARTKLNEDLFPKRDSDGTLFGNT